MRILTRTRIVALAMAPLLFLGFAGDAVAQNFSADVSKEALSEDQAVPGHIYVRFADDATAARAAANSVEGAFDMARTMYGVTSVDPAFPMLEQYASKHQLLEAGAALRDVYLVRYSGPHDPARVARAMQLDPDIVFAEPRYVYHLVGDTALPSVPDDPRYDGLLYMQRMQMEEAWDEVKGEDGDAVIAIHDAGTEWRHEDLKANAWTNPGEIADNGIDDDDNGFVDDVRGWNFPNDNNDPTGLEHLSVARNHGTSTAGNAAAVTNNGIGTIGTSWNAEYMAINGCCEDFSAICYVLEGTMYAAVNGATVMNASWGSSFYSETAEMVFDAAFEMGTLVIAAAGNGGGNIDDNPFYPASYASTLAVGGTWNHSDQNYWNYGRTVDVFAAGLYVDSPAADGLYRKVHGTSFASPLVAGIAALVKTAFPDYGPGAIREQLRQTADNIDAANFPSRHGLLGRGRVNAYRAVTETGFPGLRLTSFEMVEEVDDGLLAPGETITLNLEVTNFLTAASGLKLEASTDADFVSFVSNSVDFGALGTGESKTASLEFTLADHTPYKSFFTLAMKSTAGQYTDTLAEFTVEANAAQLATHDTGKLRIDVTSEGNFGYLELYNTQGIGFLVNDRSELLYQIMWESGLMVGAGPDQVSDVIRGKVVRGDFTFDHDLVRKTGSSLILEEPGDKADQQTYVVLNDDEADNPIGIDILQESWTHHNEDNEDNVFLRFTVKNTTAETLENIHVGLHFDLDVQGFFANVSGYDATRGLGYQAGRFADPPLLAGFLPLTGGVGQHWTALDMFAFFFADSNDELKWLNMTGGIQPSDPTDTSDWSSVSALGPYTIASGEAVKASFALVTGTSMADLGQNADNALYTWDTVHELAARVQFIQTVSGGSPIDVYVYDQLALDDAPPRLVTPYSPVPIWPGLPIKADIVAAGDADNSNPIWSGVLEFEPGISYHILAYGTADEAGLTTVAGSRRSSTAHNTASFYVAHAAPNLGDLNVRLLNADDYSEVLGVLDHEVGYGTATRYVSLIPDVYIVEFQDEDGYEVGVWRLDLNGMESQAFSLHLLGTGTSGRRADLDLLMVTAAGAVSLTPNITSTETAEALPEDFALHGNYPNPFNPSTRIHFDLPATATVTVDVIDLLGRHVLSTRPEEFSGGADRFVELDASSLASGTYVYRIRAEMSGRTEVQSGRMLLIK